MRFPGAILRSLISTVLSAILLVSMPHAGAADAITIKPAPPAAGTQPLMPTLANLGFGNVAHGQQKVRPVTIANLDNSNITLFQTPTKENGFTLRGLDVSLAGGDRFGFSGVFAPQSSADASGRILLVSEVLSRAKPILALGLRAMAIDGEQLTVDPPTLDFGSVLVGSNASQMGTLIASDSEVTIFSANIGSPEFTLSGLSFPFTIPAGGSQAYTVTFTPPAVGDVSATLSFLAYDGSSLATQGLAGSGEVYQAHSVSLSWNSSTSQDVVGYNIYRKKASGRYRKINSALEAGTAYTDAYVSDGDTYYYVATAVDSNGQESVYSNEVKAIIP
jgi:hypothetical protein